MKPIATSTSSPKGKTFARNTLWNLLGQGLPVLLSVAVIPRLIHQLGDERFGVLTIAWTVIGYLSLFDLGLGRALTKEVSGMLGGEREAEIPVVVWTSLVFLLFLGVVGGVVCAALSPVIVYKILKVPVLLQQETLFAFFLLAFAVPMVVITSGLRGVLEALQSFQVINLIRIPMGILMFVGPWAVTFYSPNLVWVVLTLVGMRILAMLAHTWACLRDLPALRVSLRWDKERLKPLLNFGLWSTIANILGPIMVSMDRFLIGGVISLASVAYYTTPFGMVTKLWILPSALVSVLFPAFSQYYEQDRKQATKLFERGVYYVSLALFPACLLCVAFAHEGLGLWLKNPHFVAESAPVLQWLALGVFVNGAGQIATAVVQGAGHPDWSTKYYLWELPFYLLVIWWGLQHFGVVGAALAWTGRVVLDLLLLLWATHKLLPDSEAVIKSLGRFFGFAILSLILASFSVALWIKVVGIILVLIIFGICYRSYLQSALKQL